MRLWRKEEISPYPVRPACTVYQKSAKDSNSRTQTAGHSRVAKLVGASSDTLKGFVCNLVCEFDPLLGCVGEAIH